MASAGTNGFLQRLIAILKRALAEHRRMNDGSKGAATGTRRSGRKPGSGGLAKARRRRRTRTKRTGDRDGRGPAGPGGPRTEDPGPIERPGRVEIVYAPERDGEADPGEVVWAWVPYEDDPKQGKDRPVLIIGRIGRQLAGVPLSSRNHDGGNFEHEWVAVGSGAWDDRGRPSYAHASRLLRFDPDQIRREGSALDRARFDVVIERVRELHPGGG